MARTSKVALFLMSTAAEAVTVISICSVGSGGKGTFLTNQKCGCIGIVTVFVENETLSDLVRLVGKMLSCRHTSCTCLVSCRRAVRRHCTFVIICPMSLFDYKHDIRFLPSVLSVVVGGPPTRDVWANRISALALAFAFTITLSFPKGKVSLCTRWYELCTHLRVKIVVPRVGKKSNRIQFSCLEKSNIIQSNT